MSVMGYVLIGGAGLGQSERQDRGDNRPSVARPIKSERDEPCCHCDDPELDGYPIDFDTAGGGPDCQPGNGYLYRGLNSTGN